jgi:hypothetical protein
MESTGLNFIFLLEAEQPAAAGPTKFIAPDPMKGEGQSECLKSTSTNPLHAFVGRETAPQM